MQRSVRGYSREGKIHVLHHKNTTIPKVASFRVTVCFSIAEISAMVAPMPTLVQSDVDFAKQ